MSGFKMFSKMKELADKGEKLPDNWNEENLKSMREPLEHAVDNGRKQPEHLGFFDSEAYGNSCPVCKSSPEEFNKDVVFGGFILGTQKYYILTCSCEMEFNNKIKNRENVVLRFRAADIPESYKAANWIDWDSSVNQTLTNSFFRVKSMSYGTGLSKLISNGLILMGDVGRGKTLSGICLLKSIIENTTKKCKYIAMADFTDNIINSGKDGSYVSGIKKFDVLFCDDIDKLSMASQWVQERVFSLFDEMFRSNKTLILTTNLKTLTSMQEYFGIHGEAIMSRIYDKMDFVTFIGGDDYRKTRRINKNNRT
jgi:DNA replication protein DnaC